MSLVSFAIVRSFRRCAPSSRCAASHSTNATAAVTAPSRRACSLPGRSGSSPQPARSTPPTPSMAPYAASCIRCVTSSRVRSVAVLTLPPSSLGARGTSSAPPESVSAGGRSRFARRLSGRRASDAATDAMTGRRWACAELWRTKVPMASRRASGAIWLSGP